MRIANSTAEIETAEIRELRKQLELEYLRNGFHTSERLLALSRRLDCLMNRLYRISAE